MRILLLASIAITVSIQISAQTAPIITPITKYDNKMGLRYYFPLVVEDSIANIISMELDDLKNHLMYLSIDHDCDTTILYGYRYRRTPESKQLRRYLKVFKRYVDIAGHKILIGTKDDYRFSDPGFSLSHYYFKIRFIGNAFEKGSIL